MNINLIKKVEENKVMNMVNSYIVTLEDDHIIFVPKDEDNTDYQIVKEFLKLKREKK